MYDLLGLQWKGVPFMTSGNVTYAGTSDIYGFLHSGSSLEEVGPTGEDFDIWSNGDQSQSFNEWYGARKKAAWDAGFANPAAARDAGYLLIKRDYGVDVAGFYVKKGEKNHTYIYLNHLNLINPDFPKYYGGTAPIPGFFKANPIKILSAAKKISKVLFTKRLPKGLKKIPKQIKRIDIPKIKNGKIPHNGEPHIHLKDGRAFYLDGKWRHGDGSVPQKVLKFINFFLN